MNQYQRTDGIPQQSQFQISPEVVERREKKGLKIGEASGVGGPEDSSEILLSSELK